MKPRRVVISAVSFTEGGPLTVLRDCLEAASRTLPNDWDIVAFVHDERLISDPRVRTIAIASPKRSWAARIWLEWWGFRRHASALDPDLWLSLHDMTPNVGRRRQVVYCHNPTPFFDIRPRDALFEPRLLLWRILYHFLYRINIGRNFAVVVQQAWLREEFRRWVGPETKLIVAHPVGAIEPTASLEHAEPPASNTRYFLYPALARAFKNFEVLCEAARILERRGVARFEVRVTISGNENRYARWLYRRFAGVAAVRFIGRQSREQMRTQYDDATAVVVPSRLETWGLPITEAKQLEKPLLVADLPYAHETVGSYAKVSFFPPHDAESLADQMQALLDNQWNPGGAVGQTPAEPYAADWVALWRLLVAGL